MKKLLVSIICVVGLFWVIPMFSKADEIVDIVNVYSFVEMSGDIAELEESYPQFIKTETIGHSVLGMPIYAIVLGNPLAPHKVMMQASIHAREFQTTQMVMKMIEYYADSYSRDELMYICNSTCFYIVPMVNPDGVTIAQFGSDWIPNPQIKAFVDSVGNFGMWKSNARGVDLNRNFGAGWDVVNMHGVVGPWYQYWKGTAPDSEPEVQALEKYALSQKFDAYVNFHQRGNVLYYGTNLIPTDSGALASKIRRFNRYVYAPDNNVSPSFGTYADWVCARTGKPSVTLEVGTDYGTAHQNKVKGYYAQNRDVLIAVDEYVCGR